MKYNLTETEDEKNDMKALPKDKQRSLILILASVFLWFMGYNAIISKVSDYVPHVLQIPSFTLPLLVANVTAIIAFIPIGIISTKIGRRKINFDWYCCFNIMFWCSIFCKRRYWVDYVYCIWSNRYWMGFN